MIPWTERVKNLGNAPAVIEKAGQCMYNNSREKKPDRVCGGRGGTKVEEFKERVREKVKLMKEKAAQNKKKTAVAAAALLCAVLGITAVGVYGVQKARPDEEAEQAATLPQTKKESNPAKESGEKAEEKTTDGKKDDEKKESTQKKEEQKEASQKDAAKKDEEKKAETKQEEAAVKETKTAAKKEEPEQTAAEQKTEEQTTAQEQPKEQNPANKPEASQPEVSAPEAEQPSASAPAPEKPSTPAPTPEPEQPKEPEKVWHEPVYENKWVVDQAAWDETVSEPIYEMVEHEICSTCGADFKGGIGEHLDETMHGGWYSNWVQEQTGTNTYTVHHDEVGHYEQVLVKEGYWG